MARRAANALAAVFACAALALPAEILASHQPAAAAVVQSAAGPPVSIFITGMSPRVASPTSTISVTGTLRNNSKTPYSHLFVQLLGSPTPVASVAELQADTRQLNSPANMPLTNATWQATGSLAPGASADWSIQVPASAISMTRFGVYPLAAQLYAEGVVPIANATTYLPYQPARKGTYASTRPKPTKIAWLWPVIDRPLLNQPWQGSCFGPQASALALSVSPGGRLSRLALAGSADQDVTWIVDPAVLANVKALTGCQGSQPRWAKAASAWLTNFSSVTSGRPLTVTPYGDPNVAALIYVGHAADVTRSFDLGRSLAGGILKRSLSPAPAGGTSSATASPLTQAAGIAWSADSVPDYGTVEALTNDGVRTLVLSTAAFGPEQKSLLKTLNGGGSGGSGIGSYLTALLASQALTQLLGSQNSAPGSAFITEQQFLAETALLAQRVPAQPIVVAPPARWDPSATLAAGLLAQTQLASWLSPVSLPALASTKHIQTVPNLKWPALSLGSTRLTRPELRKLRVLNREINQLQHIRARPDPNLFLAISALESSAWHGQSSGPADAMLATVTRRIIGEQQDIRIIAEKRITLGGLKGSVPVSIDNRLGFAVKVQLQLQYSQARGIKIVSDPQGPFTVPAHQTETIRLRVQATQVGSTTVSMLLASQDGAPLSAPQLMTIQATQVGILGMIIFAAALGVFLIASAVRAVRRGRPGTPADQPAGHSVSGDHDGEGSADRAEPDTVMAEHSELGAVGKRGP